MKINLANIESMGGCIYLPFEPNTPDIPEIDGVIVEAAIFDGYGVFHRNNKYYKISYPQLEEIKDDEQVQRTVNQYRYGNRLPYDFEITQDDLAITYGQIEECSYSEYVSYMIDGLVDNVENLTIEDGEREILSPSECIERLRSISIQECAPKYLFYYIDREDLALQFNGEIYPVKDYNGDYLCDVLIDDLIKLEENGIVEQTDELSGLNETIICSPDYKDLVLASRFEAIIFLKD